MEHMGTYRVVYSTYWVSTYSVVYSSYWVRTNSVVYSSYWVSSYRVVYSKYWVSIAFISRFHTPSLQDGFSWDSSETVFIQACSPFPLCTYLPVWIIDYVYCAVQSWENELHISTPIVCFQVSTLIGIESVSKRNFYWALVPLLVYIMQILRARESKDHSSTTMSISVV